MVEHYMEEQVADMALEGLKRSEKLREGFGAILMPSIVTNAFSRLSGLPGAEAGGGAAVAGLGGLLFAKVRNRRKTSQCKSEKATS